MMTSRWETNDAKMERKNLHINETKSHEFNTTQHASIRDQQEA
jgi:hypothetical protein